jgi:multicomponent Na+:H+ antiporter subunit G
VDTLGIVLLMLGMAVYAGFSLSAAKLLMGAVVIMLGNPVAAHALARAARRCGHRPWENRPGKTNQIRSTDALDS